MDYKTTLVNLCGINNSIVSSDHCTVSWLLKRYICITTSTSHCGLSDNEIQAVTV